MNLYGCDSTVILHLTVLEPPSVSISAKYDCHEQSYHLVALTTAPYIDWSAQPADSAGLTLSPPDAYAHPSTAVAYLVRADWRDTLFCPAYDTIVLQPALLPSATISTYPEFLTENSLSLRAEAHCHNAQQLQWFVNQHLYAENQALSTYTAEPLFDSVLLAVVVENDLCADTSTKTINIYHETLYIPNIFLPESGDDNLRLFRVRSNAVTDFEITIYSRSGEPVFHSTDIGIPWDGTYAGTPCPQGAYMYHIRYRTPSLTTSWQSRIGTITLVR